MVVRMVPGMASCADSRLPMKATPSITSPGTMTNKGQATEPMSML